MSSEITCPVCQFEHIPHDRDTCPQCDSDLICFRLLDTISDRPRASVPDAEPDTTIGKTHKSKTSWQQVFWGLLILTIFCFGVYWGYRFLAMESMVKKIEIDMAQATHQMNKNPNKIIKAVEVGTEQIKYLEKRVKELTELTKDNEIRLGQMMLKKENGSKSPEREIKTLKNPDKSVNNKPANNKPEIKDRIEKTCFKIYQAKDEDTLWDISRDLYGSGIFYPILMEHNPDLQVYSIGSKNTLRYLCDKTLAAGVYRTITSMKQNRRYWKYTIRSGDTRKAIIKRYCMNQKDCLVEDKPLKPGMTIGVFLE